jgi:hypothetical protein
MGKGFFISDIDTSKIRDEYIKKLKNNFLEAKPLIKKSGLTHEELTNLLKEVMED